MYYVYKLICPIEGEVKYIGLSGNIKQRYSRHCIPICGGGNDDKARWILSLRNKYKKPIIEIIAVFEDKKSGLVSEREAIDFYISKGCKLFNFDYISQNSGNKPSGIVLNMKILPMANVTMGRAIRKTKNDKKLKSYQRKYILDLLKNYAQ